MNSQNPRHPPRAPSLVRRRRFLWSLTLALLLAASASAEAGRVDSPRIRRRLSDLAISFVENAGQTDPAVAYSAQTFAGTVFVARDGRIVYSLPARSDPDSLPKASPVKPGWSLTEAPVGGRACPEAGRRAVARVNYFVGSDPARWRSGLPTYEGVSLGEVWPGISLELEARGGSVEKIFTAEPGSDPSNIRMAIAGARSLRVDRSGALIVGTGLGDVTFTRPIAYQESEGARRPVEVVYELRGADYGFGLADYDPDLPVVIDPLVQATYLGGGTGDFAHSIAIQPTSGDVYVAGYTYSTNFPGTAGGAQTAGGGTLSDAFVARLNSTLTALTQATYLGGSGDDFAYALTIQPTSGDIFVTGRTSSGNFPGTAGGAQPAYGGGPLFGDGFVARLNSTLTTLVQATYLGGSGDDFADAVAIHPTSGDVYVAGHTFSTNFPGTAGGAQTTSGGGDDSFVARLNPALTVLGQATYLGGSGAEIAFALAIHPASGDVFVTGYTSSTNLPGTAGGVQPSSGGLIDAFVARFNPALTVLTRATYLGGGDSDFARAIAIHPATGEVYVAGQTNSTNFPGTTGGAQPSIGGGNDAFLARLNPALTTGALTQATYLGGSGDDFAFALAIHPASGDVSVAGYTLSTNFPGTAGGEQASNGGGSDAFVARLNPSLTTTALVRATYLGGGRADQANALAIHPASGDVYVAGSTTSSNFPGTAGGAQPAQAASDGSADAFIARLTSGSGPSVCSPDATTLCLNNGRFRVQVRWTTSQSTSGAGQAVVLTGDTGYFWFFSANNVEMVVKVVDGRSFNSRFWVFAGGLTDVNVVMTVTDTLTGAVRTYTNPQGVAFQPIQDTNAFAGAGAGGGSATSSGVASTEGAASAISRELRDSAAALTSSRGFAAATAARIDCVADATTLCLNGGRFKVQTHWTTPQEQSGAGQAVNLTSDTGYFWFFSSNNVEMVVKAVTGCSFNSRYWVFAGGLTNVNVVMTITDTQTGAVRTYTNPQVTAFQPIQDTSAFPCP